MRRAAVAVTFVEIFDAPTEGSGKEEMGPSLTSYVTTRFPMAPTRCPKGKSTHFIACFLTAHYRCSRQPTLFNQWIKSNRHTVGRTYYEMWLKTLHGLNAGTNFADALRETALS